MSKNIILDATVFTTLQACARLTDFKFNLDLQAIGGRSPSIEMGSLAHTIIEHYYKKCIDGADRVTAQQA